MIKLKKSLFLEYFLIIFIWLIVLVGVLNTVNVEFSSYFGYEGCSLNQNTGLLCPSCGGTRAFRELFKLNIIQALKYNALVILMIPIFIYYSLRFHIHVFKGEKLVDFKLEPYFIMGVVIFTILFSIIRNII